MSSNEITLDEATALAIERARTVLRGVFPEKSPRDAFEREIFDGGNFWIFFRNRKIHIPSVPDGIIEDDCAYAVGRHGMVLTIKDNFELKIELAKQVDGLRGYFLKNDH